MPRGGTEMKKWPLIAVALVTGLALSLVGLSGASASAPGPAYLNVRSSSAAAQNGETAKFSAVTDGAIPHRADAFIQSHLVVGIGWADLTTGRALVVTIHPLIGRDSHQNPDAWHAHTVTVSGGATPPNDFCLVSIDSTPTAGIQIHGNTMDVNVRMSALPEAPSAFNAAAGFTLEQDPACASGLAVRLVQNP